MTTIKTAPSITPMKSDVGVCEMVLADDLRESDTEPGDDEHEEGSDQDQEHGIGPLPTWVAVG